MSIMIDKIRQLFNFIIIVFQAASRLSRIEAKQERINKIQLDKNEEFNNRLTTLEAFIEAANVDELINRVWGWQKAEESNKNTEKRIGKIEKDLKLLLDKLNEITTIKSS